MDIWAQLWPNPHPGGKVHISILNALIRQISLYTRYSTIYTMVELAGIKDECDRLATTRAIRDKRDEWRNQYSPDRKAICA